jgi:hypothetical protein
MDCIHVGAQIMFVGREPYKRAVLVPRGSRFDGRQLEVTATVVVKCMYKG